MSVTLLDPDGLSKAPTHSQVAIATGSRQIHVSGQVAYDADGQITSRGDLTGQVAKSFRNLAIALTAAGATFADVVRLKIYVVDWTMARMPAFMAGIEQVAEELQIGTPPSSLIGVSILFDPDILVEIEATAVVD